MRLVLKILLMFVLTIPVALAFIAFVGIGLHHSDQVVWAIFGAGAIVFLPGLGLGSVLRNKWIGASLGTGCWSCLLLLFFPLYFPGDRASALSVGTDAVLFPMGQPIPADLIALIDEKLPSLGVSEKGVVAQPVAEHRQRLSLMPGPIGGELSVGGVALPIEGDGATMDVAVAIEGRAGVEEEVLMIFDTGATLTTLKSSVLDRLGVQYAFGPEVTLHTAGGPRVARLALINRLWLGGYEVEGVTVAVCDVCGNGETVGMLGLNVSGRFRVTYDPSGAFLYVEEREAPDHRLDLRNWVDLSGQARQWRDGSVELTIYATNNAPRSISRLDVEIRCDATFVVELEGLSLGEESEMTVELPVGTSCDSYQLAVGGGKW